ncbi:MAG TPA: Tex family protein [Thermoanaerobaculia bacterium]|nr:Tex family protein [Thermoanaerobaculia bacterium]
MAAPTNPSPPGAPSAVPAVLEPAFVAVIAAEAGCRPSQVEAAAGLFAEGATVPFVARYRKEATGGLEDVQLELVAKRRDYFLELAARRDAILASLEEQGKLTPELAAAIRATHSKQELEDLYLPYRPKRRTRAQIARERGLEPLADALLAGAAAGGLPEALALPFVAPDQGVEDAATALAGARDVLAERLAESAPVRSRLRRTLTDSGVLAVRVVTGKDREPDAAVYRDYFEHQEPARGIPSHRLLAILRGEREGYLVSDLRIDDEREAAAAAASWQVPLGSACGREVAAASADGYKRLLRPSIANEVRGELRQRADAEAIAVFRANLEALLLQAPFGQLPVMGLDPGLRTGCKLAVVEATGRVVATDVIFPVLRPEREAAAAATVLALADRHGVRAIAIGNGTASRETEVFVRKVLAGAGEQAVAQVTVAVVPETGASVYSASAVAREELPELDVSLRGAVSIARRLQDPLAELVKIEPRSLGVGQYQHDVDQKDLERELDTAVEGAVNRVGVELNSASAPLLRRISGLSERLARAVVERRERQGPYRSRQELLQLAGFGPRTFELAAGFLRVRGGDQPLDATGVHPERYPVVQRMAGELGVPLAELVGNPALVSRLDFARFADAAGGLGSFTLGDIRAELERPGRDPRPDFRTPRWRPDVTSVKDLAPGMVLEGRVSNVTNFGAFVDVGVHRDGLVHVSELAHRWIGDPRQAVQVGQIVTVKVLEVDVQRERVSLSLKAVQPAPAPAAAPPAARRGAPGRAAAVAAPARKAAAAPVVAPVVAKRDTPGKSVATIEDLMRKFNRR